MIFRDHHRCLNAFACTSTISQFSIIFILLFSNITACLSSRTLRTMDMRKIDEMQKIQSGEGMRNSADLKRNEMAPNNNNSSRLNEQRISTLMDSLERVFKDPEPPLKSFDSSMNKENAIIEVDASDGFVKAAELFRRSIDERVDPCEDFFEFSCGKWNAENEIPADLTYYGHFPELREKVNDEMRVLFEDPEESSSTSINTLKQIYRSCMDIGDLNRKRSSEFLRRVKDFGYWPIIYPNLWKPEKFDLSELLVHIGKSRAIDVFVDVYVSHDQKNVSRRLLHFDQGSLGLGASSRDYYLNETRYAKQLFAYEEYMTAKILLFAADAGVSRKKGEVQKEVKEMIELEKRFAKIIIPDDERRNHTKLYNIKRLSAMERLFPDINWRKYFKWIVPEDMQFYLNSDPEIIVTEPEFFDRLSKVVRSTEKRVIANYIFWRYASAWSFQLDERFDNVQQDFLKTFIGKNSKSPRWKDCISAASNKMSYASGAMYVRKYFDKSSKEVAMEMIEDLRTSFMQMLRKNDWMDKNTQKYALEKANDMISLIGFPDFLFNDTALDEYYTNLTLTKGDTYAIIVDKTSLWAQRKAFRRLVEEVDRLEFGTSSAVVNAFYSGIKNAITFPAAVLQAPFFDQSFPKAVNYGSIGSIIGHEITHGFDDQGSQFDKIGNLKDWWDPKTQEHFVDRKRCIIDQYSSFEVPFTNMRINGILTQGENIADNGGVTQSYNAYQNYLNKLGRDEKKLPGFERYTSDQIFFMSFGQTWCGHTRPETAIRQLLTDPHSPQRFRVNGVVVNQPEFARAFNCPIGSPMNPEKRCALW